MKNTNQSLMKKGITEDQQKILGIYNEMMN